MGAMNFGDWLLVIALLYFAITSQTAKHLWSKRKKK